jgi:hypothetical protein
MLLGATCGLHRALGGSRLSATRRQSAHRLWRACQAVRCSAKGDAHRFHVSEKVCSSTGLFASSGGSGSAVLLARVIIWGQRKEPIQLYHLLRSHYGKSKARRAAFGHWMRSLAASSCWACPSHSPLGWQAAAVFSVTLHRARGRFDAAAAGASRASSSAAAGGTPASRLAEESITSTANAYVKHCVRLRSSARYRREQGRLLLVGSTIVRELAGAASGGWPEWPWPTGTFTPWEGGAGVY